MSLKLLTPPPHIWTKHTNLNSWSCRVVNMRLNHWKDPWSTWKGSSHQPVLQLHGSRLSRYVKHLATVSAQLVYQLLILNVNLQEIIPNQGNPTLGHHPMFLSTSKYHQVSNLFGYPFIIQIIYKGQQPCLWDSRSRGGWHWQQVVVNMFLGTKN